MSQQKLRNLTDAQIKRAELGLDGIDHVQAGESLKKGYATREDSAGNSRVDSSGNTRVCSDTQYHACWWKIVPAIKSETVVMGAGCEVLFGEAPKEDDTATAASPIYAPLTTVVTKGSGGNAHAFRLR